MIDENNIEFNKVLKNLKKEKSDYIREVFNVDLAFYDAVMNGDNDKLNELLNKGAPLVLCDLEEELTYSEELIIYQKYEKVRTIFEKNKITDLNPKTKELLLNYLFHRKDMVLLRYNLFSNETDIKLINKYYSFLKESLGYLKLELNYIWIALINNKSNDVFNYMFDKYSEDITIDVLKRNSNVDDAERYKKILNVIKIKEDPCALRLNFYQLFNLSQKKEIHDILYKEYAQLMNLDNEQESEILFKNHFLLKKSIYSLRNNTVNEAEFKKLITIYAKNNDINKVINFLSYYHINKKYYEELLIKNSIESNIDFNLKNNNNKSNINKI